MPEQRRQGRFHSLAITHAVMTAGEASMVVALADSFFFDVDLDAARSRLLAFLLVGFAPFLMVNAKLGPIIDRLRGGRRAMVIGLSLARVAVQVGMIFTANGLALFPFVFAALVLQKTYAVTKQAIVPSVVRDASDLVEANSKLGRIATLTGAAAVIPAAVIQQILGTGATLFYGAVFFVAAAFLATRLPRSQSSQSVSESLSDSGEKSTDVHVGWIAMTVLRFAQGFTLFQVALWFRATAAPQLWLAAAVGLGALAPFVGNTVGPWLRRRINVEKMLAASLAVPAVAAGGAVFIGGYAMGVVLSILVNFSSSIGRLAFESIVQRDGSERSRAATFAWFETRFQFGWVAGAAVPILVEMSGVVGISYLAAVLLAASISYVAGARPFNSGQMLTTR
ncbi:MAG: hypothetical protein O3B40_05695 [Actinobacteria bacterium]|nr:hypothetical protein [Ilumatobacteraceae bacterium]MDA0299908.1 hypothetical protein [Actinomycetota bacterium]MDA2995574.1 hypothetical protein [Actinomycetota bacterium]